MTSRQQLLDKFDRAAAHYLVAAARIFDLDAATAEDHELYRLARVALAHAAELTRERPSSNYWSLIPEGAR